MVPSARHHVGLCSSPSLSDTLTHLRILYSFSALSCVVAGIISGSDYRRSSRGRQAQSSPIKGIMKWLGLFLVWEFLAAVFGWLPRNVQARIRYSWRSARKWTSYKGSLAASKVNPTGIHLPQWLHRSGASDEKLVQILLADLPYDILQLIAVEVHYADLVNLSMVSKQVRAAMFPGLEDNTEDRQLRFHSCRGNMKSSCWTCGVQVCGVSRLPPC